MTHNLPHKIREHFAEQNQKYLEQRICPVYRHRIESKIIIHDLSIYGLESNSCMECNGKDNTCKIYQDYLSKEKYRIKNE